MKLAGRIDVAVINVGASGVIYGIPAVGIRCAVRTRCPRERLSCSQIHAEVAGQISGGELHSLAGIARQRTHIVELVRRNVAGRSVDQVVTEKI